MKGKAFAALAMLGILLAVGACSTVRGVRDTNLSDKQVPLAPNRYLVVVSADDFTKEVRVLKQVEVNTGETFTIALDSNATTGFGWTEQAKIANTNILTQKAHQYIPPQTGDKPAAGMGGIEEWTFTAGQAGTTTVNLSYDRPWEGGEKGARTFELTLVVK